MNGEIHTTARRSEKDTENIEALLAQTNTSRITSQLQDSGDHKAQAFRNDGATINGVVKQPSQRRRTTLAIAYTVLPEWLNITAMVGLIFGGCCANVFALEAIVKEAPSSGTLITCSQFLLTSLLTVSSHLDLSRGIRHFYLKPRAVPLKRWVVYTALFFAINVLNNKAFGYKISVPLHIILRSAGPVATMAVGYCSGRRYRKTQVVAVILLFVGVVQAAVADARAKGASIQLMSSSGSSTSDFLTGFGILYLALMLSAIMGVFTDKTYARYGRDHWSENLFYSHTLSLPFFLAVLPELRDQSQFLLTSPTFTPTMLRAASDQTSTWFHAIMANVPVQVVFLLMNAMTQYLCIRGVNLLAARSSSLTVTIVLNIRKLVSLLLSIWLFGNRLAPGVLVGAAIVFVGGGLYAWPPQRRRQATT